MEHTTAEIYFAGGCFWGTERYFQQIHGVVETTVGYANGTIDNPTYQDVCTDTTGFAETVRVRYNPRQLPLTYLVQLFFRAIDPTSLNRQGHDVGTQYRTGIYYTNEHDKYVLEAEWYKLQRRVSGTVVVEVKPLSNFFTAEEYHQDYLVKNPDGYCHLPLSMFDFARKANPETPRRDYAVPDAETLRQRLTPLQWAVTQEGSTEPPFDNPYDGEHRAGIYVDVVTGEPLFLSTDKFDSGCGWPAFSKPIDMTTLEERHDSSHGMSRVEVLAHHSGSHLGHVFTDGPAETGGLRYCINSASLRFVPVEDMERQGYGAYLPMLQQ